MSEVVELNKSRRRLSRSAKPLTVSRISNLQPRIRQYWEPDAGCPGLYVRVNTSGAKSYYIRGRIGGGRSARQRNIRIGDVARVGLPEARTSALRLLADMRAGNDPLDAPSKASSITKLIDEYGADLDRRGVVNVKAVVSSLNRNMSRLMNAPADTISRALLVQEIERCHDRNGPSAATAFRGFAAAMLNWAVNAGKLQSSVLAGYKAPRRTKLQRLAQIEQFTLKGTDAIKRFWAATGSATDPIFRDYMRFLLMTGQRRGETAEMTWGDVHSDRWIIRAVVTKSGREHVVPLGPLSLELLDRQVRQSTLVWPGRGNVPMSGWSKRLRPIKAAVGEPQLAMHALRRGYRTGIRELGADTDLCEVMIGHSRRGLVGRYDKSEMWAARVAIQSQWETWLKEAVSQQN